MQVETTVMKNELRFLNLLCFVVALLFIAFAVLNAVFTGQLLTTDNLFITMVCMVMALVFGAIPIFQMKDEGRLSIPFQKRLVRRQNGQLPSASTPLLDAKGRAVPPDVRAMMSHLRPRKQDE
jgi:hypothetical protein